MIVVKIFQGVKTDLITGIQGIMNMVNKINGDVNFEINNYVHMYTKKK